MMPHQTMVFSTAVPLSLMCNSCSGPEQTAASIIAENEQFMMYKAMGNAQDRFAVRTTAATRSGTFTLEVVINPDMVIQETRILSYPLTRGRGILQPGFLSRFHGKTINDPIQVGNDIHAVTGDTMSSIAMSDAVRQSLAFAVQYRERMQRLNDNSPPL
ncbi:MAG TPA: hypothetical protein ENN97_05090 [Phycisphaerales bacterium]|nr:hypothetical protein [Phycisphaerales bacterium]